MDKKRRVSLWVFIVGILIIILGSIHVAATFLIFPAIAPQLPKPIQFMFLYLFIATGAAVIFSGALTIYGSRGLKTGQSWAWAITNMNGMFMFLLGVGAILAMPFNPFAYLTLIIAIFELTPIWLYRRELQML
jgi:hypothetical protein